MIFYSANFYHNDHSKCRGTYICFVKKLITRQCFRQLSILLLEKSHFIFYLAIYQPGYSQKYTTLKCSCLLVITIKSAGWHMHVKYGWQILFFCYAFCAFHSSYVKTEMRVCIHGVSGDDPTPQDFLIQ